MPITDNILTLGWKGTFKKQVVFRQRNGRTIVSAYPNMSERTLTPKQKRVTETMKEANMYVNIVLTDERSRMEAQVRLNVPRNRLYNALIKEYYANHYQPLKEDVAPASEATDPVTVPKANYDFMKYLLENTEKSVAEIAQMTDMAIDLVFSYQNKYRKEKPIIFPPTQEMPK